VFNALYVEDNIEGFFTDEKGKPIKVENISFNWLTFINEREWVCSYYGLPLKEGAMR
jgi:hypothetical protein